MGSLSSPLGWFGGKHFLAKKIVPIVDSQPHTTYVEPFAGGASIFFKKQPSTKEVLNDINPKLIQFYEKLQTKAEPCLVYNTKEEFSQAQQNLNSSSWTACDFFRVNKGSFAGKMIDYGRSSYCDQTSGQCHMKKYNQIYPQYEQRLKNVKLHNQNYINMIQQYDSPDTFFYVDPPYDVNSSKFYKVNLSAVSPEKIAENFKHVKGKVLISFNDSPEVRSIFQKHGYFLKSLSTSYNATNQVPRQTKEELLITNFKLP